VCVCVCVCVQSGTLQMWWHTHTTLGYGAHATKVRGLVPCIDRYTYP